MFSIKPKLSIKEIDDIYIRKNFESIDEYFKENNQLYGFKFVEVVFDSAKTILVSHGLGYIPKDVIRTRIFGTGNVTINYDDFDSQNISLTSDGPAAVRLLVGNYFDDPANSDKFSTHSEVWYPSITSVSSTSSSSDTYKKVENQSTYTILSSDSIIFFSNNGTSTIYLPDATTSTNKKYTITKSYDDYTSVYTIYPVSSQTINGSSTTTLNTYLESIEFVSDGSNWIILKRNIPSEFTSFTPNWYNFATQPVIGNGSITGKWRRLGECVEGYIRLAWGSTTTNGTGGLFSFGIPSGMTIDSTKLPGAIGNANGSGYFYDSSANQSYVYTTGIISTTRLGLYMTATAGQNLITDSAPVTPATSDVLSFNFKVPISGWKG